MPALVAVRCGTSSLFLPLKFPACWRVWVRIGQSRAFHAVCVWYITITITITTEPPRVPWLHWNVGKPEVLPITWWL